MTDSLLKHFTQDIMPQHHIVSGTGLDIACGTGENLVYLASNGWKMTGIDRSKASLQTAHESANLAGVTLTTIEADLETSVNPFSDFAPHCFDLITVSRYLHRPLLTAISSLIKPGGILVYQTFMVGCESSDIGKPSNPDFLLKSGELASRFVEAKHLVDEETTTEDGRPYARFIAQF